MKIRSAAIFLALSAACFGSPSPADAATSIDKLEASVNSSLILSSDIALFRRTIRLRSQLDPIFAGTPVALHGEKATDEEIVQFLVDEKLISQYFPVNDAEVEQEINSIQSNNKIDRATLKSALQQQGFSFDDYFELIRASASKRNLIDRDIRTKVTISDDDVRNYYYNHYSQDGAKGDRAYQIRIIFISPKTYKTKEAARAAIENARKAVMGGEAFEEVAKRVSDDASASSGGDLGALTDDQMSPQIREGVRQLAPGETSRVLGNAKSGYYLIKLVDVKATDSSRLAKVKDEIRAHLMASEYQHQISLWIERQRQTAFIHLAGQSSTAGIPGQSR